MTEIYLIRHGETENNRLYKFVGSTDQPLNDRGAGAHADRAYVARSARPHLVKPL